MSNATYEEDGKDGKEEEDASKNPDIEENDTIDPSIQNDLKSLVNDIDTFIKSLYEIIVVNDTKTNAASLLPMRLYTSLYTHCLSYWMNPSSTNIKPDFSNHPSLQSSFDAITNRIQGYFNYKEKDVHVLVFNTLYTLSTSPFKLKHTL